MRCVASVGHEPLAPISWEYADIPAPPVRSVAHSLLMFARQGCDSRALPANDPVNLLTRRLPAHASPLPAVAKLQRARDTFVGLLIRGMDEYAAYRGRGPQLQRRGGSDHLGQAF